MGNGAQRRSEGGKREAEGGKLGGCVELCSPKQSKSNMGRPAVQTGDGNGVLGVIHGDAGMPPRAVPAGPSGPITCRPRHETCGARGGGVTRFRQATTVVAGPVDLIAICYKPRGLACAKS